MPKQGHRTTRTSSPAKTSLTKDEIAFGELVLTDVSHTDAAAQVWPHLKQPAAKGSRTFAKDAFQLWYRTRKEITEEAVREITAHHKADYESRVNALAEAFSNPRTKWREKLQIHDKLTVAEGRKVARRKDGAIDFNLLEALASGVAAGATAVVRSSVPERRLPAVPPDLSLDSHEGARATAVQTVAAPAPDVAGPAEPSKSR